MTTSELYELARKYRVATGREFDDWYRNYWPKRYEALEQQFGPPIAREIPVPTEDVVPSVVSEPANEGDPGQPSPARAKRASPFD